MIEITYKFNFNNPKLSEVSYKLLLNEKTTALVTPDSSNPKLEKWTDLNFCKCENCPHSEKDTKACPIAKNISNMVFFFKDHKSFEKCTIGVHTEQRSYMKKGDVQTGLFSILGIVMATSGCPFMDFLRPMARYHLPFSTIEETLFRSTSSYLLGQYLSTDDKKVISFDNMLESYANVEKINAGILNRIRNIAKEDADPNALVILNGFAQFVNMELTTGLKDLTKVFNFDD